MNTGLLPSQRFKPASKAEAEEQLFRVANGANIEHGFALDFSRRDPVLKLTDEYLKEHESDGKARLKAAEQAEKDAARFRDLMDPIESFATAPRDTASTPPVAQDTGRGSAGN
jgi:hypothetical protein